ncbi:hypothetical protein HKL94_01265 [Candidatus Parcubacteria bacterium]|nr:hypothetical protein [Candidatus Parcubacteria bacterium]
MTDKINSYFAVLIITIFGAGASLLIIHVVYASTVVTQFVSETGSYTHLQNATKAKL